MEIDKNAWFRISQVNSDDPTAVRYLQFKKPDPGATHVLERPFLDSKINYGHTEQFQFRLTPKGAVIESHNLRLIAENGEVHQDPMNNYGIQMGLGYAVMADDTQIYFNDQKSAFWSINTQRQRMRVSKGGKFVNECRFRIEMPYGDRRPRLICKKCFCESCEVS